MKKLFSLILTALLLAVACIGGAAIAEAKPEEPVTVIYEAFFLNNDEIAALFTEVRGEEAPYAILTQDFHITTRFRPERDMRAFYGTKVTVHIYAYQTGEIPTDEGGTTANEGFFCTITTEDPELQDFIDHLEKNWHITGSYRDQGGARYTEHLDLTGAQVLEYTVTGCLGGYLSNGSIVFSPGDADRELTPAEEPDLSGLYESTAMPQVYSLSRIGLDGCAVRSTDMHDGYILLVTQDSDKNPAYSDKAVLFPIGDPETVTAMAAVPDGSYRLLDGGTVLEVQSNGDYTLYSATLKELCRGQPDGGVFLGASRDGDLWFLTEDRKLVLHRAGAQAAIIDHDGVQFGAYLGKLDGKAYFDMTGIAQGLAYLCIDPETLQCTELYPLYDIYDVSGGVLSYSSEDYWMIAGLEDPLMITFFRKPFSEENAWQMDDRFLISEMYQYDQAAHTSRYDYSVYDLHTGALLDHRADAELAEHAATTLAYDQGLILYADITWDNEQECADLYLWDIRGLSADQPASSFKTLDFHMDQARVDELIGTLHVIYGINIYYDAEHLAAMSGSYELEPCTNWDMLGRTLLMLRECMAEYPRDFFDELITDEFTHMDYYLCDRHAPVGLDTIDTASATAQSQDDALIMTFDVHYWWELRTHFLHENVHLMEHRLASETPNITDTDYVVYWYEQLNSPDCPSMHHYNWPRTPENTKGVLNADVENAWYVDDYAKNTPLEDRARTLDKSLHSGSAFFYESPHINRKLRFLNALIREVFPCIRASEEPVFWETRTGIVDLYEEFPEFVRGK